MLQLLPRCSLSPLFLAVSSFILILPSPVVVKLLLLDHPAIPEHPVLKVQGVLALKVLQALIELRSLTLQFLPGAYQSKRIPIVQAVLAAFLTPSGGWYQAVPNCVGKLFSDYS